MKKIFAIVVSLSLLFSLSANALAADATDTTETSETKTDTLPDDFSFDVTLDEIENSINQYISKNNMNITKGTEEYTELLYAFCFSDFPDLTDSTLRYYQAYASVYLSNFIPSTTYQFNETASIGEIRQENQKTAEKLLEIAAQYDSNKTIPRFSSYDLFSAREYAKKYAEIPNLAYQYYITGDCTNFASQILYAGGMEINDDWTPQNGTHGEINWINANCFTEYWSLLRGFIGPVCHSLDSIKSAADVGDFISWHNKDTYSFYHVQFVQSKTSDREVFCTQHTPNYYNEKLSSRISSSSFNNEYVVIIDFY